MNTVSEENKAINGESSNNINDDSMSIIEILGIFWKHKFIIISFIIIGSALMFVKTAYFTDLQYTSIGVLYVSNNTSITTGQTQSNSGNSSTINKSDIDSSRTLSSTYMEVLNTRTFLTDVSKAVDEKYDWKQIKSMTTIAAVNETELLAVSVTCDNPDDAYNIVSSILKLAPGKLSAVFKRGAVEVVDDAMYPSGPNSKGLVKNVLIGFMAGLVLGAIIAFLMNLFDTKIHKSSDLSRRYNISVLGDIVD